MAAGVDASTVIALRRHASPIGWSDGSVAAHAPVEVLRFEVKREDGGKQGYKSSRDFRGALNVKVGPYCEKSAS
jgi:hypothetical protein